MKRPETFIPDDFEQLYGAKLTKWLNEEYPKVDAEKTFVRFREYAQDKGRLACCWTSCFKRVVRAGIDNEWKGICVFKNGKFDDPRWTAILTEVKPYGFRTPYEHDTPGSYRTDFELWKSHQKRATNVTPFGAALRTMAK